ncbi:D-lactate dehydrogenase, putative [Babesia ovis]|uniref:D-lactate dehydrogenase, putative n=1 Tax=Babesia ovis TaxID=5869 RepID=A0A9W5TC24_BABOV|nr:D-lactate dehydrogenase, putative [Babesia ovis]
METRRGLRKTNVQTRLDNQVPPDLVAYQQGETRSEGNSVTGLGDNATNVVNGNPGITSSTNMGDPTSTTTKAGARTDGIIPVMSNVPHTYDTRSYTETNTESYQTNVDGSGTRSLLLQDAHNIYFSHMPRVLGTDFRFQVGEIAYIKWKGELNLVVIQFVSQKLVMKTGPIITTTGNTDSTENDNKTIADDNNGSTKKKTPKGAKKNQKTRTKRGHDVNMKIFRDPCSERLYHHNRLGMLPVRLDNQVPPDLVAYQQGETRSEGNSVTGLGDHASSTVKAEPGITSSTNMGDPTSTVNGSATSTTAKAGTRTTGYFMPIYFVTFPGYKKKCAKTFRFWVKEKDLIKFNSITQTSGKNPKAVVKLEDESGTTTGGCLDETLDTLWKQREVQDINEYVYDIVYNVYQHKNGMRNPQRAPGMPPWCVPKALKKLVQDQQTEIMKTIKEDINYYSISAVEMFSKAPMIERLSAYAVVQNFKYILFRMANMMRKGGPKGKPGVLQVDEVSVPSLRLMEQLETAGGTQITAQQFQDIYLNNIYWLDIYLAYMDKEFLETHCHNEREYEFLYMTTHSRDGPLSKILGLEHLARMFCFPVLYNTLLKLIERGGEPYPVYIPITQLLLHYMAFVAIDYTHNQKYMPSHLEAGLFKISHLKQWVLFFVESENGVLTQHTTTKGVLEYPHGTIETSFLLHLLNGQGTLLRLIEVAGASGQSLIHLLNLMSQMLVPTLELLTLSEFGLRVQRILALDVLAVEPAVLGGVLVLWQPVRVPRSVTGTVLAEGLKRALEPGLYEAGTAEKTKTWSGGTVSVELESHNLTGTLLVNTTPVTVEGKYLYW